MLADCTGNLLELFAGKDYEETTYKLAETLVKVFSIHHVEDKLKLQIEEWQTRWNHLQEVIDDKIKAQDFSGAYRRQCEAGTLKRCIKDAYAIIEPHK